MIMSNTSTLASVPPAVHLLPLVCHLMRKEVVRQRGPVPFMAEIELENVSDSSLEIEYFMTALQHLNLIVADARGTIVSEGHYGDRFAPSDQPGFLRLASGQKFAAEVHLFATMPRGPIAPGTYSVQAVYEYNGFRAESEPVEVTV